MLRIACCLAVVTVTMGAGPAAPARDLAALTPVDDPHIRAEVIRSFFARPRDAETTVKAIHALVVNFGDGLITTAPEEVQGELVQLLMRHDAAEVRLAIASIALETFGPDAAMGSTIAAGISPVLAEGDPQARERAIALVELLPPGSQKLLTPPQRALFVSGVAGMLDHPDGDARLLSVRILGNMRPLTHPETIAAMVSDADPRVRAAALQALALLGDPMYLPQVRAAMSDAVPAVRREARGALQKLAPPAEYAQALIRQLDDPVAVFRRDALQEMDLARSEYRVPQARRLVNDESAEVRAVAVSILVDAADPADLERFVLLLGTKRDVEASRAIFDWRNGAKQRADDAGVVAAIAGIARARIGDGDPAHRVAAVRAFELLNVPEHAAAITPLLVDTDASVRSAAQIACRRISHAVLNRLRTHGLGEVTPEQRALRLDLVAGLIDDANDDVRLHAIATLCRLAPAEYASVIAPHAADSARAVRIAVLRALTDLGDPRYLPQVRSALADTDPIVRIQARQVLQKLAPPGDHGAAIALQLGDPDAVVRRSALEALRASGGGDWLPVARRLMDDESAPVRLEAARMVCEAAQPADLQMILLLLGHEGSLVQSKAEEAIRSCRMAAIHQGTKAELDAKIVAFALARIDDPAPAMRLAAVRALQSVGAVEHLDKLGRLSADGDTKVQQAALAALSAIGGEPAGEYIRARLTDPDPWVRQAAIAWLRPMDQRNAEAIAPLLNDPDPAVRAVAQQALAGRIASAGKSQSAAKPKRRGDAR